LTRVLPILAAMPLFPARFRLLQPCREAR